MSKTQAARGEIATKTARLNELMAWFDGEEFDLAQAVEKYAEATRLADEIEAALVGLKNQLTQIEQKAKEE